VPSGYGEPTARQRREAAAETWGRPRGEKGGVAIPHRRRHGDRAPSDLSRAPITKPGRHVHPRTRLPGTMRRPRNGIMHHRAALPKEASKTAPLSMNNGRATGRRRRRSRARSHSDGLSVSLVHWSRTLQHTGLYTRADSGGRRGKDRAAFSRPVCSGLREHLLQESSRVDTIDLYPMQAPSRTAGLTKRGSTGRADGCRSTSAGAMRLIPGELISGRPGSADALETVCVSVRYSIRCAHGLLVSNPFYHS
jgi:hypothetical protein